MQKFSANLGMLWPELPLVQRISAAKQAGFHAVEFQWPYDDEQAALVQALQASGLPLLGINTSVGDRAKGDFGLAALAGHQDEARAGIDQAVAWGKALGARAIHVMAGKAAATDANRRAFCDNLAYACDQAAPHGIRILIEAINTIDVPGYFLSSVAAAAAIRQDVNRPNLKLMLDLYHCQRMQGELLETARRYLPHIGHIQFAGAPARGAPHEGEVNFQWLLPAISALGYDGYFGAEYRPQGPTEQSLDWLAMF